MYNVKAMNFTRNISILSVVLAAHLVFAFTVSPKYLLKTPFESLMAQVGVGISAGVPVNEHNALAEELRNKEIELAIREKLLNEGRTDERESSLIRLSYIMTTLLAALVAVNFIFDYKERKRYSGDYEWSTPSSQH